LVSTKPIHGGSEQVKERDLQDVKVGDFVASMSHHLNRVDRWTGTLHEVKNVTAKQFLISGMWFEKATGRQKGRSSAYHYELATPEMIAEWRAKNDARKAEEEKRDAFHDRQDHKDASAIQYLLSEMSPDNHPLDLLSPEEWAHLRKRLGA
jgi:hypothetical protein